MVKTGQASTDVIVQEGVLTNERVHDGVAEPVVYMMDRYVVGGFYRVHAERAADENLNAAGRAASCRWLLESAHLPQPGAKPGASAPNRFYMYGVIGRLAMVAASYETRGDRSRRRNLRMIVAPACGHRGGGKIATPQQRKLKGGRGDAGARQRLRHDAPGA